MNDNAPAGLPLTLFHSFFEIHIDLNLSVKTTANIILIISAYQILSVLLHAA